MRRLIGLMIISLMLLSVAGFSQLSSEPNISTNVLKYDPSPAEPGKSLEIWISIKNNGPRVDNYVVELVPEFPFSLEVGENATREYAFLDSEGIRARYKLTVADNAANGDAILKIKHYRKGSAAAQISELAINVLGKVDVNIDSVNPDTLTPGKSTRVEFALKNSGKAPVNDLIVSWSDPNKKILSLGQDNRKIIERIDVNQSAVIEFSMIADPSITQGVHFINVNLSFQRFGTTDTRTSQIAFIIGGTTDFDVAQQNLEDSTLSLSVANIGVNTATGTLITIPDQPGWKIIGGSNIFLGNLNPGDFTVASLQLQPLSADVNKLNIIVEYTDTIGTRESVGKNVSINFAQLTQKKDQPNYLSYIIIIVILAGLLYMVYKRYTRGSRK
ncbi:MAG: hypothetical protein HZB65_04580 [Candidatus Aenigmarchaeota archaeon]|nr:hypothetical protein [Candidatus Aenigmarchaeota archaeon]